MNNKTEKIMEFFNVDDKEEVVNTEPINEEQKKTESCDNGNIACNRIKIGIGIILFIGWCFFCSTLGHHR